jgi:hypothetical protein
LLACLRRGCHRGTLASQGSGRASQGGVQASRGYDGECQSRGHAELSRTSGLSEIEEMGATAMPPPSREELGIAGNGEVGYNLRWGWSSVGLMLLLWAQC